MLGGAAGHLRLHRLVVLHADDGLVGVFRMIHGQLTTVGERLFGDVVLPKCGLKEQVASVGVVPQHLPNTGAAPGMAVAGGLALGVQLFHDGLDAHAGEVVGENTPHDLALLWLDDVNAILVPIPQHLSRPGLAVLEVFLDAPLLIFAGGEALLLCVGCQDGQHQLTVCAHGVDVLFLEVHIHPQRFQIPDGLEQHHSIPGEPGDRLGDDEVDVPGAALGQQPLEILPVLLCAGQGLVCVHPAVEPAWVVLDEAAVVADLGRKGVEHGVLAGGHSGVGRDPCCLGLGRNFQSHFLNNAFQKITSLVATYSL